MEIALEYGMGFIEGKDICLGSKTELMSYLFHGDRLPEGITPKARKWLIEFKEAGQQDNQQMVYIPAVKDIPQAEILGCG